MSGDNGKEVTPVPMPNTEVKLLSADGSEGFPFVRVGRCHAHKKRHHPRMVSFLVGIFLMLYGCMINDMAASKNHLLEIYRIQRNRNR